MKETLTIQAEVVKHTDLAINEQFRLLRRKGTSRGRDFGYRDFDEIPEEIYIHVCFRDGFALVKRWSGEEVVMTREAEVIKVER